MKINQISLDESGEHMGVCSEDGKVRGRVRCSHREQWSSPEMRTGMSSAHWIPALELNYAFGVLDLLPIAHN